jgi:hypothetical protein
MKQISAVEWLYNEWAKNGTIFLEDLEQAKEMEKEQIIESYCQGCFDMWKDNGIVPRETADEYYNETFKSDETASL